MKYFAMIDGEQRGPFELDDLVEAGVRPDTYVWCKGMPDWAEANEVPDICRYFRQRLAGIQRPATKTDNAAEADDELQQQLLNRLPPMARRTVIKSGMKLKKEDFPNENEEIPPSRALPIVLFIMFLLLLIFGFFLRYLL